MHPYLQRQRDNGIAYFSARKTFIPADTVCVIISGMTCRWRLTPRGLDSCVSSAEGDDCFKETPEAIGSFFFSQARKLASQRKRTDRVIECYAREERAGRSKHVVAWRRKMLRICWVDLFNANNIYPLTLCIRILLFSTKSAMRNHDTNFS